MGIQDEPASMQPMRSFGNMPGMLSVSSDTMPLIAGAFLRMNSVPRFAVGPDSAAAVDVWKQTGMSSRSASSYSGKKYGSEGHLPASRSPFLKMPHAPWSLAKRNSCTARSMLSMGGTHIQRSRPLACAQRSAIQRL